MKVKLNECAISETGEFERFSCLDDSTLIIESFEDHECQELIGKKGLHFLVLYPYWGWEEVEQHLTYFFNKNIFS